jgi:hypothetical protein
VSVELLLDENLPSAAADKLKEYSGARITA